MAIDESMLATSLSLHEAFAFACKAAGPIQLHTKHRTTGAEQSHVVNSPFVFVGRSPAAGVRLDDPSISQCHAYLQFLEGAVHCIDLGSRTGVIWDDGSQGRGWVEADHTLRMGMFDVRIDAPAAPPLAHSLDQHDQGTGADPILSLASVEIHSGTRPKDQLHLLDRPITLLGRHPACELRLVDDSIAYFQCALVNTPDGLWLVDILSRQGALLNGRHIRLARLRDADLLEFGKVSLVIQIGAHSRGSRIALREPSDLAPVLDNVAVISGKVADAVAGAFVPVGEMMNQFQQCFLSMAQMFTSMQQEHSRVVSDQMRVMQEMMAELRELRCQVHRDNTARIAPTASPQTLHAAPRVQPPPDTTASASPLRSPSLDLPAGDAQTLSDAHSWFLNQLANKGQVPPPGS
jgi:pSer/pThr/pTyr-binding forkhead associated (FHA) protein